MMVNLVVGVVSSADMGGAAAYRLLANSAAAKAHLELGSSLPLLLGRVLGLSFFDPTT
jgi:hypothetical protein